MTLWDGLTSSNSAGMPARIVVLGATNRINDIDEAILRRMPKKFPVPLPETEQRRRILQLILQDSKTDPQHFDLDYVANITAGLSGSDLKEACRDAAMAPVREYMRQFRAKGQAMSAVDPSHFRGIRSDDFFRREGGQIIMENHRRHSAATGSRRPSNGYEELDEPIPEEQD